MAILQDIRNRAGIFIMIFVGVALFLFVIDPSTFSFLFERQDTKIAKINKKGIEYEEFLDFYILHEQFLKFAQRTNSLDGETMDAIRDQAWNDVLRKHIVDKYFSQVGLSVGEYELEDLIYGANIHSIIHQNFTNQQTGMLDTASVRNFFARAEEDIEAYTITEYFKQMIKEDRLLTKYNNMIAKGYYVPVVLAKKDFKDKNTNVSFDYVLRNFASIPDQDIKLTEADFKEYYDKHIYMFQVEENSRDLEYVLFSVIPSAEDSLKALEIMTSYYEEFIEADNPTDFARRFSDFPLRDSYLSITEMPTVLDEEFFVAPIGTASEILQKENSYFAAIITDRTQRPDSVNASHILIRPSEERSMEAAKSIADSLFNELNKGADFLMMAFTHSEDPGSQQSGGELGWFTDGVMVPEFNDACFNGKPGDIVMVETQFGIHIIKINEQTQYLDKFKLAVLQKEISYSEQTFNHIYSQASTFSANSETAKEFDENVIKNNYIKRIASNLEELDKNIPGLENPREIIRWVYSKDIKVGDVSDVFISGDRFIVAKLTAIREKGNAPLDDVKDQIEPVLIKNKKAEIFIAELDKDIKAGNGIEQLAQKYDAPSDQAQAINFGTFSVPGLGIEPEVISTATNIEINKISKPVKGNSGVFVLKVTERIEAPEKSDYSAEQLNLMRTFASRVGFRTIEALQKKAVIEDFRTRWF